VADSSDSVTLKLADEIDLSRGDLLASPHALPHISGRLDAMVVWLHPTPLELNRVYLAKHTGRQLKAKATNIRFRVDVNTLSERPTNKLEMNEIASVEFETSQPLFFDPYRSNRTTGSFILIDPLTNATVGAAMIREALPPERARQGLAEEHLDHKTGKVTVEERIEHRGHRPAIFTLTGERRHAEALERALLGRGFEVALVDLDELRPAGRRTFFSTLWNLGLLILSWRERQLRPKDHGLFKTLARESYFDLSDANSSKDGEHAFRRVLDIAETLRTKRNANEPKED
jgi:hypothetical protein